MDGIHDLGGMAGFGKVDHEKVDHEKVDHEDDEPVFHEPWHATAFALLIAGTGPMRNHNSDEYRHSIERMAPSHYLGVHYYERVLTGITTLLVEKGKLSLEDLESRAGGAFPLSNPIAREPMVDLKPQSEARFRVGERIRVLDIHPAGHTRVPRFVRGKTGMILRVAPAFSFPDASAHGGELRKEHTYHVEFESKDLWGDPDSDNESVIVDLWDSYLEKIDSRTSQSV